MQWRLVPLYNHSTPASSVLQIILALDCKLKAEDFTTDYSLYISFTAISIKVVHEQSGKVEYERDLRERLLGFAKKMNLLAIPSSLACSYSTFRFARGQP